MSKGTLVAVEVDAQTYELLKAKALAANCRVVDVVREAVLTFLHPPQLFVVENLTMKDFEEDFKDCLETLTRGILPKYLNRARTLIKEEDLDVRGLG